MKTFVITVVAVILFLMVGCAALQDSVTPCAVDEVITEYVKIVDPNFVVNKWLPYTTLSDSKRIQAYFDFYHIDNQVGFQRLLEDDNRFYDFATGRLTFHQKNALAFQQQVFSPNGLIGLLAPTIFGGTLGALLIKRPQDKSPIQVAETLYTEAEVDKIKAEVNEVTKA